MFMPEAQARNKAQMMYSLSAFKRGSQRLIAQTYPERQSRHAKSSAMLMVQAVTTGRHLRTDTDLRKLACFDFSGRSLLLTFPGGGSPCAGSLLPAVEH